MKSLGKSASAFGKDWLGPNFDQVKRAAYSLAETNSLKHPWDGEKKISESNGFAHL
jgi:hypothetical protein